MASHERFNQRQLPYIRAAEAISNVSQHAVRIRPPATDERYYGRWCVWGSPDTVTRKLQKFVDVGLGNFLMSFNNGIWDEDRRKAARRSMTLFAKEVMPRFADTAPPADPLAIDLSGDTPQRASGERLVYV
jgi:hypothetical protein